MKNTDENKKLLNQIAKLESNSMNYFDVDKEFFLIDSDNLAAVQTKFYGYSIQATGIYEDDNLTENAARNLDGRGCYVYVEVRGDQITIRQDLNGSWGIYLFRHENYFALSNSFFRLLDYLKLRFPLTLNRDYCNYLLANPLCSHAYSETAVNEIRLIERNAILQIDTLKKTLAVELIDYREHSVSLDSAEGIATLDGWFEFWCRVFRGLAQHANIRFDLSGGFDTRIPLALLLNSGIDLKKILFNSYNDKLHTHSEDFAIASKIAKHYGFDLIGTTYGVNLRPSSPALNYSSDDVFNMEFYILQTINKHPYIFLGKRLNKTYDVVGFGGETIRGNWLRYGTLKKFKQVQFNKTADYSTSLSAELLRSVKKILASAFRAIGNKYEIKNPDSLWLAQYLYQESRSRSHHGKICCAYYFGNNISISPCFDPALRTLKLNAPKCPDPKLLMALIFARYEANLLKFPFEGKRSIVPETIAFAKKISENFPRRLTVDKVGREEEFNVQPIDKSVEKILVEKRNNELRPTNWLEGGLKAIFDSSKTQDLFNASFSKELYEYAATYYDKKIFGRIRYINGVVGVAKILESLEVSKLNRPIHENLKKDFF